MRTTEQRFVDTIIDPIPVVLRDGVVVAASGHESVGAALLARNAAARSLV